MLDGIQTIDCTPSWSGLLRMYVGVMENDSASVEARQAAMQELTRMASLADKYVEALPKLARESNEACPTCGGMDSIDCIDMDQDSDVIISFHSCECGCDWTARWECTKHTDIEMNPCEGDDMQDIIDDDNKQRADDMNAELFNNGSWT